MNILFLIVSLTFNLFGGITKEYTVIATSGLNLRFEPSTQYQKVAKISYGESVVQIAEMGLFDTINSIPGHWIKVKYQDSSGYVFDPFLVPSQWKFPTSKINSDYALLLSSCTCFSNFQYDPQLKWYGVYQSKAGTCTVKGISFSYHRQKASIGEEICVTTSDQSQPLFIIGSRYEMGCTKGISKRPYESSRIFDDTISINHDFYYDQQINELIYCYENREIDLSEKELYPRSVIWRGDLNQDGIEDFIIEYGEKVSKLVLVISEVTNRKVHFKKVAEYYSGYCC